MSEMVSAIRSDSVIGRGTCSTIDEAYTDAELIEFITDHGCRSAAGAVKTARAAVKLVDEYDCGMSRAEREAESRPDFTDEVRHPEFDYSFGGDEPTEYEYGCPRPTAEASVWSGPLCLPYEPANGIPF